MDIFPKEASPAMSGFILNLVGPDLLAHPETKLKVLVNPDAVRAFSAAKTVHGIVVPSVAHCVTGSSNGSVMFGAALAAVAYGSHIIGLADWTKKNWNATLQLGPSLCEVTMKGQTTERLEQRRKDLCVVLARLCAVGRSKWKIAGSKQASPTALSINCMADLAHFLQKAQRVSGPAKVGGKYFAHHI